MTIYGFHKLTSTLKSMEGISSDERYFEGLLTVQMKDKQGEVTIVDELYKVLPVWVDRGAPISDTHSNRIVGKGINYSRTTVKSDDGAILPAIKITGKIFKNYELDNVIWNKIKNNEYKGLSFGGATRSARSPIKMKDGTTAYALSDLEHYEVAVCADPAVPMAIITDFNQIAKANFNSSVRDDGKMVIQCDKMGCYVNKEKGDFCPNCGKGKKDLPDTTTMGGACPNCGHGFKPKPNTFTATDVKPIQKAGEMAGGGNGGGDLLTTMEGAKPENYKAVEEGKQRGQPIDKTYPEPTGLTDKQLKLWREIQEDVKEDSDNQYYTKFMEKKEMLEATLGNKEEKRPTQPKRDMRETETSGYKPDLEKAIEIINKAGYRVDTEDRNNGTEINDTQREIPEKKLPIKGSLSQELPRGIQQANLNESQTFEQKVQALMAEGKSRESAEKIVGSFVHKVEASSGSGGAGIGGANLSNGGTITTQTGGANNPIHNSKCECDKCRSKGLDISNTGSFGVTEGAFNQNPPNAQRLNNKSDNEEDPDYQTDKKEFEREEAKIKKPFTDDAITARQYNKADEEEDEEVAEAPEVEEERPEWEWLMNRHKAKATRELNKVHVLMKLNKVRGKMPKNSKDYTEDEERDQHIQERGENSNQYQAHFSDGRIRTGESSKAPAAEDRHTSIEYTAEGKPSSWYDFGVDQMKLKKALSELKKIKRNPTAPKSTQNSMTNDVNNFNNWARLNAGAQGHNDIDSQEYSRRLQINAIRAGRGRTEKYPMPPRTGLKQTKRTVGASRAALGSGSGKGDGALGKSIGDGKQAKPRSRNPSRDDAKKPHDKDSKDDDHESPPAPKIRYSRSGGDNPRWIRQSLDELIKKLPKKISDEGEYNKPKWKAPDELPYDELDHTDVHGLAERGNSNLGTTNEVPHGDSIVQNTSSHGDIQSNIGRKIRERGHGDKSGMQATMSRRNANIMRSNIEKALDELRKLSTFKAPPEKHRKRITVESIIAENKKEREEALKRVREQKIGVLEKALAELNKKKAMTYRKTRGNVEMKYPTVGEEVWDSKQQKRVKETKTPKRTMALEKALAELKKLQISGGLGSRGLGSEHGYTQGQQESTQVTLVQPRPEDDRVQSKRTTKEPKKQQL